MENQKLIERSRGSVRAIDKNGVITDINEPETSIRKIDLENTGKAVFLCDSTKFEQSSVFTVCKADDTAYIVTDKTLGNYTQKWKTNLIV